jgi:hypothetical protein
MYDLDITVTFNVYTNHAELTIRMTLILQQALALK